MAAADPGFPVGGTPTSDAGTLWQKRKNWVPLGGGGGRWRSAPGSPTEWDTKYNVVQQCYLLFL